MTAEARFAVNLIYLREKHGLKRHDVTMGTGISTAKLGNIERMEARITLNDADALCRFFGEHIGPMSYTDLSEEVDRAG